MDEIKMKKELICECKCKWKTKIINNNEISNKTRCPNCHTNRFLSIKDNKIVVDQLKPDLTIIYKIIE